MKLINVMNQERVDEMIFDYIEGEMDPSMRVDFQNWLRKDAALQARVRELGGVRHQIKKLNLSLDTSSDFEAKLQANIDSRMNALHDKIMAGVNATKPKPRLMVIAGQKSVWQTAAAIAFAVLTGFSVMKMMNVHAGPAGTVAVRSDKTVNQMMVDASMRSPDVVGEEGLSSEDQIDMYMDIMAKRMGKMDDRQNQQLMNDLKQ